MRKIICFLGSHAPSLVRLRGHLIAELASRGHGVIAVVPGIDGRTAGQIRALGAEPIDIPMARTATSPLQDLVLCRDLTALFRARKPDVLIPYTAKPVIWGSIAAQRAGVPLIVPMITGLGYAFSQAPSIKRLVVRRAVLFGYARALPKAHKVLFQNPDDLSAVRKLGLLPRSLQAVVVNGSGVDLDQFAVAPLPDAPVFLMIARLLRSKGVKEYAEAANMVRQIHPEARFRLAGWIDHSPDAIKYSDLDRTTSLGVEFLGPLEDVRPALAAASICVLPSYYGEGTPRYLLEGMAMGRPIITTDTPGCKETVPGAKSGVGENGILVPVRDPSVLAAAMVRLAADARLRGRMGEASRRIALAKYDVRKVNATILSALNL